MTIRPYRILLSILLLVSALANREAQGRVIEDEPHSLSQISSIGESLRRAGQHPVHILYVHGIGATEAGDSKRFQKSICDFLKDCLPKQPAEQVPREYVEEGDFKNGAEPPAIKYMGKPVWKSADDQTTREEWSASAPFVDHYVLRRNHGAPIVVDEINWWPLVFPLKCRDMLAGEARLAGPAKKLLDICSQPTKTDPKNPGRFESYNWIGADEAKMLEAYRPKGALFNRSLKNYILDWGFSDAIMAVGSMRDLFREAMRQLFVKSVGFSADGAGADELEQESQNPCGADREFIIVAHSLGSYLVFSTLSPEQLPDVPLAALAQTGSRATATEDSATRYIFERTSLVYFFANQIPLLELANVEETKVDLAPMDGTAQHNASGALSTQMMEWKSLRQSLREKRGCEEASIRKPPQVIAWSDPSDLLTWYVPKMDGFEIKNFFVRNTIWHWLIAGPVSAHANYDANKDVLRVMLGPKTAREQ